MNPNGEDQELNQLLTAAAHVVGCDEPQARDRLLHIIQKEPCTDPGCSFCDKSAKKERRHMSLATAWTLFKIAVAIWAVFAVAALAFAMVYGEEL